jgi:hypothetical protein
MTLYKIESGLKKNATKNGSTGTVKKNIKNIIPNAL